MHNAGLKNKYSVKHGKIFSLVGGKAEVWSMLGVEEEKKEQ